MIIHQAEEHDIVELCLVALADSKNRVRTNYSLNTAQPNTLINMHRSGKFAPGSGEYLIARNSTTHTVICGAGYYKYDSDITLGLARCYITPTYKATYPLTSIIEYQLSKCSTKKFWVTFNDCNKSIYDTLSTSGKKPKGLPAIWAKFTPIGNHSVNYIDQWVAEIEVER